ncbi:hypothetical protein EV383_4388 [Pseudonocardia sediminis]|uniref:Uncharacterized protein n=1 Tax=Pseudonocardia sediminis TaxID=1397368 RepID=A0A4Q7V1W2_PSEST|nr:hypothetical protein [Pseudonocardia sediminis]RZT87464.1 hypothetical protein EV383_4388 [Pseudonocardia sediminis]
MARSIGGQTVRVIRRERVDGALVESGVVDTVAGCFVEPRGTTGGDEATAGKPVREFRVYGGAVLGQIRTRDLVEVDGWLVGASGRTRLDVAGQPAVWPDLRGRVDHVELDITYAGTGSTLETVIVVRAARDNDGDIVGAPTEHAVTGCTVRLTPGSEDLTTGQRVTTKADLYVADASADIRATDRVRRASDPEPAVGSSLKALGPWRVIGSPETWPSANSTGEPGLIVHLERTTG